MFQYNCLFVITRLINRTDMINCTLMMARRRKPYHSKNSDHQQIYERYKYDSTNDRYIYDYSVALIPLSPLSYHTISPHKHHN